LQVKAPIMDLQTDNKKAAFMKVFSILLLAVFLSVFSCTPIDLNSKKKRVDRGVGEKDFDFPKLRNISLDELEKTLDRESCFSYQPCPSFSLLGTMSPGRGVRNCLCKAIDQGLKPLCDEEAKAKELLRYYQDKKDKEGIEDVEEDLRELESVKYNFSESIYEMADEINDLGERALDQIEKEREEEEVEGFDFLWLTVRNLSVNSEFGSFTRVLDSKARLACRDSLDFSKIKARKTPL